MNAGINFESCAPLLDGHQSLSLGPLDSILQCHYHPDRWAPEWADHYGVEIPAHVERAVPKRLSEYVAGRELAQRLLASQGCKQSVGRQEEGRAPRWPEGFIGSITHSDGVAASTVLPASQARAVGVDVEHWLTEKTADTVASRIWSPLEAALFLQNGWEFKEALTTAFSAKESLFKALNPLCGRFFGFPAAVVSDIGGGSEEGELMLILQEDLSAEFRQGQSFAVQFRRFDSHVMTATLIAHL